MTSPSPVETFQRKANRIATAVFSLFYLAMVGRTFPFETQNPDIRLHLGWILGLELVFLGLFVCVGLLSNDRRSLMYIYFTLQSGFLVAILIIAPSLDFVPGLFILLIYQAAMFLTGRVRWAWIAVFVGMTAVSSIILYGLVRGLALGLVPVAGEIVIAAGFTASLEVVAAQSKSQSMVRELQATQEQLKQYASQVEELATIEERNRLARELHDSVSQTLFSIQLNTRSTQLLLEKDPDRVKPQLIQLQELAQSALAEMRSFITQLRFKND